MELYGIIYNAQLKLRKAEKRLEEKIEERARVTNKKKVKNAIDINPTIAISSLNISGLSVPVTRDCQSGSKKHDQTIYCLPKLTVNMKTHTG